MNQSLVYRISIGLALLLALSAFITTLGWIGSLARSAGHLPVVAMIPWVPIGLVALAAINCTLRARFMVRRREERTLI